MDRQELDNLVEEEVDHKLVEEVVDHKLAEEVVDRKLPHTLEEDIQQLVGKADLAVTCAAPVALPLVEDQTCHLSCPFQPYVVSAMLINHSNLRCKLLTREQ